MTGTIGRKEGIGNSELSDYSSGRAPKSTSWVSEKGRGSKQITEACNASLPCDCQIYNFRKEGQESGHKEITAPGKNGEEETLAAMSLSRGIYLNTSREYGSNKGVHV